MIPKTAANREYRTPNQLRVMFGLAGFSFRANMRNGAAIFFSFIFPLVLVFVFGALGGGATKINLGVPDGFDKSNQVYAALKGAADHGDVGVKFTNGAKADLDRKLKQSKVDTIIQNPDSGDKMTLKLETSNGNPNGKAAEGLVNGFVSQLNLRALQQGSQNVKPPFAVQKAEISGKTFKSIDFALPGLIGFSLLSIATFGVAFTFIALRETLVLKRIFATTVRPLTFIGSQGLSRAAMALLQVVLLLGVGVIVFHFNLAHGFVTILEMLVISFIGLLMFMGFGILISNIAKDEQSAPILLNLFNLPQFLLSGVFFSSDGFPKAVRFIGDNLPLSYLNQALRKVSVEGLHLPDVWPYLLGMLIWGILAYILAAKTFKAE